MKMTDAGEKLWCSCCGKPVGHEMRSLVKQHINSASHVRNKEGWGQTRVEAEGRCSSGLR